MKIKIVLLYDEGRSEIGKLTEGVARSYCAKHGYELAVYNRNFRPDRTPHYCIMSAIRVEMERSPDIDWFLRLDSDAIIVDPEFKLEFLIPPSTSFLGTSDWNGLCTGVCMVKNSGWGAKLLETLNFLGNEDEKFWPRRDKRNTFEQSTLKCLIEHFPEVAKHVDLIPEIIIQNPRSEFNPKAFMMHYWGNTGQALIAEKMREVIANGWSRKAFYQWGS